jgi:hypothetical protein
MFTNSNGPRVHNFKPEKYVKLRLQNLSSATDNRSRVCSSDSSEKFSDASKEALGVFFSRYVEILQTLDDFILDQCVLNCFIFKLTSIATV